MTRTWGQKSLDLENRPYTFRKAKEFSKQQIQNITLSIARGEHNLNFKYINDAGHCVTSPKGRGFDSRWCPWHFSLTQSFRLHYSHRSTQSLTVICNRNISWGVKVSGAVDRQTCHLHVTTLWKTGSINPMVPYGAVIWLNRDCFTYTFHPKPSRLHFSECK